MSREEDIKFEGLELDVADLIQRNTRGARLACAVASQPKPPCVDRGDGTPCEFFRRCASEVLACRAFYAYTRYSDDKKEYGEWQLMERVPTARMYGKTYKEENNKNLVKSRTMQPK